MAVTLGNLQIRYDDSTDVLYVSIGDPRPAVTREDEDEETLLIRKDPQTGETVGVTVLEYYGHFRGIPDLTWLEKKGLPTEVVTYLAKRPEV
jgi:uncharacterized protein YuzE